MPFFITLAHEFLHALNQLECVDWLMEKNEEFSYPKDKIQDFLIKKLKLKSDAAILQEKYKMFWKNPNFDDSLDEMTVILGSRRKINSSKTMFIGETTFLQEYYHDESIISWSHFFVYALKFWESMENLLTNEYVSQILTSRQFGLRKTKVTLFHTDEPLSIFYENFKYKNSQDYSMIRQTLEKVSKTMIKHKKACTLFLKNTKKNTKKKIERIEIIKAKEKNVYLLPKCFRSIKLENYQIVDLAKTNMKVLRKYSIKDADLIAKKFNIPIVIIAENNLEEYSLQYQCLIYTTNKQIKKVDIDSVERILNLYPDTLKLYYNGTQFYEIVSN